jgi:hypothetical protein
VFDVATAVGTYPTSINKDGVITGQYYDGNNESHGFVRAADGTVTIFDPEGATGDWPTSINSQGAITGFYYDNQSRIFGYVRDPRGDITTFSISGSQAVPEGINKKGVIAGYYAPGSERRGFVRAADGTVTTFDGSRHAHVTTVRGINVKGSITGYWQIYHGRFQGFIRKASGHSVTFDAPNAGTGRGQGTSPLSINNSGAITGWYIDSGYQHHGFLRTR